MTSLTRSAAMSVPVAIKTSMMNLSLAQTPGGSIYGTTPGGSRVQYTLRDLIRLSQSPMSRTLPADLPVLPGITVRDDAIAEVESRSSSPLSLQSLSSSPGANDSGLGANVDGRFVGSAPFRAVATTGGTAKSGNNIIKANNMPDAKTFPRQRSSNSFSQGDSAIGKGRSNANAGRTIQEGKLKSIGGRSVDASNIVGTDSQHVMPSSKNTVTGRSQELPANWRDHPDMWASLPSGKKAAPNKSAQQNADNTVKDPPAAAGTGAKKRRHHHHKKTANAAQQLPPAAGEDTQQQQQQAAQTAQAAARGKRRCRTVSETQVEVRKKADGAMQGFVRKLPSKAVNTGTSSHQNSAKPVFNNKNQQQPKGVESKTRVGVKISAVAEENVADAEEQQFELDV